MDVVLRNELPDDYREVENLTREAFWNVYCPGCSEHYLLNVMRQSPDFIDQLDIGCRMRRLHCGQCGGMGFRSSRGIEPTANTSFLGLSQGGQGDKKKRATFL